ncbi:alpha/beta hydrolase [Roseobacter sp. YSTF-M11]|uniref:Alpha/beta hydrolase n=1 Tax=Roseobacter insulae TaxID=2859783 RepID=A0A9X1G0U5_9RHOB|nr:alpha/beta hydrolase [Roseobacter insulae]MBW4710605.1 alpha/beta hydrolase [Roseobacter insulae]
MNADFHTHARTYGQGRRQALALHCTLGHSGAWRRLGEALEDRLTLVAMDLPGHGKSDDWDGRCDLHQLCTDAARRYLTQPMDVIGHSFGATVALRLAVEQPHLIRSLTLIEPVFFAAALVDAPETVSAYESEAEPFLSALREGNRLQAARLFNRFWGDGTKWDDIPEATRRYMSDRIHIVSGQSAAIIDDNAGMMKPGVLARALMPCLLIQGDRTADVIDAIQTGLAARLPGARRAVITGAGHMAPLTHPAEVAREIAALLEVAEE